MAPKPKPKDQIKKPKKNKSQNQGLLFQYFPNLNQNKTKAYQKIFAKPNAVFKEEKKLNKQILTEQNQIIKQINQLFRQVFQQATHEEINTFAQIFGPIKIKREQEIEEKIHFPREQTISEWDISASNAFMSPQKKQIMNQDEKSLSSEYTRTVTAKKQKAMDLTAFQFHESLYKEKDIQKIRDERKYSEAVLCSEEAMTVFRQIKPLIRSQQMGQKSKCIDWNEFEFNPSMKKADQCGFKGKQNEGDQIKGNLNPLIVKQTQAQQTITLFQARSFKKNFLLNDSQQILDKQTTQFNSVQNLVDKQNSQKCLQQEILLQNPPRICLDDLKQDSKQPQQQPQTKNEPLQLLSHLEINCQSAIKRSEIQQQSQTVQKIQSGIQKIIELMEKKHKAKQQELNFRNYVQQVKYNNQNKHLLNTQSDIQVDTNLKQDQSSDDDDLICFVTRPQALTLNVDSHFDVLDSILHRSANPQFLCYFQANNYQDHAVKQINYQIKDNQMKIDVNNEDQNSTKQQSEESNNSISSSWFITYLDSLEPSFNIPQQYLVGYQKQTFNQNLLKQIHQLQLQKTRYQAQINDHII